LGSAIDRLEAGAQLTLKVASVIGPVFAEELLWAIHPIAADQAELEAGLANLQALGLLVTQEVVYSRLLYAQRRQLHRAAAEWYERAGGPAVHGERLGHHWAQAEELAKALRALEQAAAAARSAGDDTAALRYLRASLELNARAGVLGDGDETPADSEEGKGHDGECNR
jgi:hypothetical protein